MSCNQVFEIFQATCWVNINIPGGGHVLPKEKEQLRGHFGITLVSLSKQMAEVLPGTFISIQ